MQYAAFDRGYQFQYHIGKRSEPKSISPPDENRQRQAKNKSGMCETRVSRVERRAKARETYEPSSKQTQADATRTFLDAFAMAGVGGISLPLSGRWRPLGCYLRHAQALHSSSGDGASRLLGVSLRSHRRSARKSVSRREPPSPTRRRRWASDRREHVGRHHESMVSSLKEGSVSHPHFEIMRPRVPSTAVDGR